MRLPRSCMKGRELRCRVCPLNPGVMLLVCGNERCKVVVLSENLSYSVKQEGYLRIEGQAKLDSAFLVLF